MKAKNIKLYGDIAKSEEQPDGTVKVWGFASSAAVDSDGEQITPDAMRAALPDYMKFANVREMHTSKAAGIAIEAEVQSDGRTFFGAHIIDSEAVKKVRAGVYKGFSIGGKVTSRDSVNKSIVNGLRLSEVSLVDRPANPEATFTFFKADGLEPVVSEDLNPLVKSDKPVIGAPTAATVPAVEPTVVLTLTKAEADSWKAYKDELDKTSREAIMKGMGHVQQLAYILQQLKWLVIDQNDETATEGDGSMVASNMADVVSQMGAILVQMTQEEVAELSDKIAPPANPEPADMPTDDIEMSAATGDLSKSGAKFSSATKKTLGDAHAAMKTACKHLDGMAYSEKADSVGDLAKMASLETDLAKVSGERDNLVKRVKELEAAPAPTNAILKVVEKSQDYVDATVSKGAKEEKPKTPESIMKSIHSDAKLVMTATGLRPLV